jgi:diguanylate cyclase (GGDEF)-like protein
MMTHLKLKYYFFNMLTDRLDEALSSDKSLSVIMFDIDFFKKFNDTYGHACGDYVLQTVARIIKNSIRGADMASRYGGEEFTVMLLNASAQEAVAVAERIRKRVETFDFFYEDQHMKVTISGGVAEFNTESNPITSAKLLVDQADQALYISKRSGRNRITFADPSVISSASNALNGK